MIRVWSSFIIGVLLFIGMAGSAFAQVPAAYDIEDLGTLGGSTLVGTAINARGDVAGNAELPDGTYHAFRWTREGGLEDLGANGGWYAEVFGINDNGDVVGMYLDEYFNQHGSSRRAAASCETCLPRNRRFYRPRRSRTTAGSQGRSRRLPRSRDRTGSARWPTDRFRISGLATRRAKQRT